MDEGQAEREARGGDLDALLRRALESWRSGRREDVLEPLLERFALGASQAGALALELLGALPARKRRPHARALARLVCLGSFEAVDLLKESFASWARIRGEGLEELYDFMARNAFDDGPLRLLGRSNRDHALVACALHELRCKPGFLGSRNASSPGFECQFIEAALARRSWGTVFIYRLTRSHYSRLYGLDEYCAKKGARPIYGARLDAWDGDRFEAAAFPEIEVPELEEPPEAEVEQRFSQLLSEMIGMRPDLSPETQTRLRASGFASDFEKVFELACQTSLRVRQVGLGWDAAIERYFGQLGGDVQVEVIMAHAEEKQGQDRCGPVAD